ncbi:MAG: hypothetical protein AB7F86_06455 [Bdellovibrionales bacterium]
MNTLSLIASFALFLHTPYVLAIGEGGPYSHFIADVNVKQYPGPVTIMERSNIVLNLIEDQKGSWSKTIDLEDKYAVSVNILNSYNQTGEPHIRIDCAFWYEQFPGLYMPLCEGRPVYRNWKDLEVLLDDAVVLESYCTDMTGKSSGIKVRMVKPQINGR